MNRIYRLVWSHILGECVVTHECAKKRGKCTGSRVVGSLVSVLLALTSLSAHPGESTASPPPSALPTGAQVSAGSASFTQSTLAGAAVLTVNQSTSQLITNWQNFDIGANAKVEFKQPNASSVALNQVRGSDPSRIFGQLSANGQVFLVNPAGIYFSSSAQVNTASLVASTLKLSDENFLAGRYVFDRSSGAAGGITNAGSIRTHAGGFVALIAPQVVQQGKIETPQGGTYLAAGKQVEIQLLGQGLLSVKIPQGELDALVRNEGHIASDGGQISLTAKGTAKLLSSVVNNTGVLQAKGISLRDGRIYLDSGETGLTQLAGQFNVSHKTGRGGSIQATGHTVKVASSSRLNADGATAGGEILLGGGWQGQGALAHAQHTLIDDGAVIQANALFDGLGGTIVAWSDLYAKNGLTTVKGELQAKGGAQGGNGGRIETSGHVVDIGSQTKVNTAAPFGKTGLWLIDPVDYTIAASGGNITGTTLSTNLASSNITILSANGTVGVNGDINVNDAVSWSANTTLTLSAFRNINFNANGTATGNTAGVSLITNTGGGGGAHLFATGIALNLTGSAPTLSIGGQSYTVINSLGAAGSTTGTDLQGLLGNLSGLYALGSNIDATATSAWNLGAGFEPVGNNITAFTGTFEGLGHTVSNLTINRSGTDYIGLFGDVAGTLRNVGLVGGSITGASFTGALAGRNTGTTSNSYATSSVTGVNSTGGLIGTSGTLSNSYAKGNVTGSGTGTGGLVGAASGNITNSYATGNVSGAGSTGGLVGEASGNSSITITQSFAHGNVTGSAAATGGLVGSSGVNITSSYASGTVSGTSQVGGLVGISLPTAGTVSVSNVYASGNVTGSSSQLGGLIGSSGDTNVANAYATGDVTDTNNSGQVGGLIGVTTSTGATTLTYSTGAVTSGGANVGGLIGNNSGTATSSYWDTTTSGQATGIGGTNVTGATGLTTAQSFTQANYGAFDFTTGWYMLSGDTRPFLRSEYSATIYNGHQLQLMQLSQGANYTLGSNISLSELTRPAGVWNTSTGFRPIDYYSGTFDGLGYTINNLYINRAPQSGTDYVGLFSTAAGVIRNVSLVGGSVTATANAGNSMYLGALAGRSNGTISNVYSSVSVTNNSSASNSPTGGLFGQFFGGSLTFSYATGAVTSTNSQTGGLVGFSTTGVINNSYATGAVVGGTSMTGGLIGQSGGVNVRDSFATGNVTAGSGNYTGGLLGYSNASAISNVYATGNVAGGATTYIGGLIGSAATVGTVTNSYSTGTVSGSGSRIGGLIGQSLTNLIDSWSSSNVTVSGTTAQNIGGLVGEMFVASTSITNSYATGTVSGGAYAIGGMIGYVDNSTVSIILSYATGAVSTSVASGEAMGGLVGVLAGSVNNSYATGTVTGGVRYTGGLIGRALSSSSIITSRANGNVSTTQAGAGYVGGLVGYVEGSLTSSFATGSVTATSAFRVGGLAGQVDSSVSDVYATGNVTAGGDIVAGLIGYTIGATVSNSYATGNVTNTTSNRTGGLIGVSSTHVINSYATGAVSGPAVVGGLIGEHSGSANTTNSYATGAVTMTTNNIFAGGLVGSASTGTISNSYSTGTVTAGNSGLIGGLVGSVHGSASVHFSYATGAVSTGSSNQVGGLTGQLTGSGSITNSYATGNVTTTSGSQQIGGLIGTVQAGVSNSFATGHVIGGSTTGGLLGNVALSSGVSISDSYATGNVSTASAGLGVGGFVGSIHSSTTTITNSFSSGTAANVGGSGPGGFAGQAAGSSTLANNYWDTTLSGISTGVGSTNIAGVTGLTTAQTKLAASFSGWNIATAGGNSSAWRIYDGNTTPMLRNFLIPLTVTATSNTKTYDTTAWTQALQGVSYSTAPDTSKITGIALAAYGSGNGKNAGTYTPAWYSGPQIGGYDLSFSGGSLIVSPAFLAVTGVGASNKVYNATTTAALSGTAAVTALAGDTVSVTGTGVGVFANKNVGTGKAVTVTGFTLTGADAANYSIVQPTGLTANITQALLTLTGVSAVNKVYDTTTIASLSGSVTGFAGDTVSVNGTGGGAFADKTVGTGKTVTVLGFTLEGTDAGNYTIVQPTSLTANITAASLTVTGVGAANKVYDTTTTATLTGTAAVSGLAGDTVSVTGTGAGAFANKNVGIGKSVTVSGFTLIGTDAGNYSIVQPIGVTANITQAALTVTGVAAVNKVYDATTTAALIGTATGLAGDTVSVNGTGAGAFADKNVGLGKAVTVLGFTVEGIDAGNYSIVQPTGVTANITAALITVTGIGAASKVYDTTTTVSLTGIAAVSGFAGDTVSVTGTGSGAFTNKNAGTGKAVNVSGFSLMGTDAGNYSIVQPTGLTASITTASLAVTGVSAANKVYDTTTTATLTGTAAVSGFAGDTVSVAGTGVGAFANKNVGTGKSITVSGFTLTGTDAANYSIVQPTGLTANVTVASLTVTGVGAANKVYDATTTATLTGTAAVSGLGSDTVSVAGTGAAVFANKNVGTGKSVTVSGFTLTGADAANYSIAQPSGVTANTTAASLTVTGVGAANKVYDTTTTATLTGTAAVSGLAGDTVSVAGTGSGAFTDKNVGIGKSITVSGFTLAGTDAGNYSIVQPTGVTANITAASLAVSGVGASNKVYDATTTATLAGTAAVSGLAGDTVSVAGTGSGAFADKNVGTGKSVTVSGFTLAGTDAGNYSIVQPTSLTASITTASLAVAGVGAANRVYDATTTATLTGTAAVSALGSDTVSVTGTGAGVFANKNVGTGKSVTVSGFTLAGIDAGNYSIVQPTSVIANITAASLAVSGVGAANKVYDTTTTASLTGTAAVSGLAGDTISVAGTGAGAFADKNVGAGKSVTVSGFTLAGTDAGNYSIVQPTGLSANITAASLAVTGIGAANKVYDTTTTASLTGAAAVSGLAGDTVSVAGLGIGSFTDKNVGTAKSVTVSGFTLAGTDAGNYSIVQANGVTANITAALLTVTGVGAANKVYDTTTTASLNGTAAVSGLAGDTVSVTGTGSGIFANKNVGTGKSITVTGFTLAGTDAGNYLIVQPTGVTANITAASLAVTGVGASNKAYDATTTATLTGTAAASGLAGDTVSVAGLGSGAFTDKNVGTGKSVTVSGFTLAGTDAGNYSIVQPTGVTANISAASLAVTGVGASNKVYDTTTFATLTGTAAVSGLAGDTVSVTGSGVGAFTNKNVGTGKSVTVSGFTLAGTDAGNYSIAQPTGVTANITAASLAVTSVGAANKVYDATLTATLTGAAAVSVLTGDSVTVAGGIGTFANKNVGVGKAVTVSGFTLAGTDAGNYSIVQPAGVTANITQASLTVTGVGAAHKVYDTTTTATLTGAAAVSSLMGDIVSVAGTGIAAFTNKSVGTGKLVTVSGFTLAGTDAGNYSVVQPIGVTANITTATLAVTGIGAANKVYDTTTTASLTGTAAVAGLAGDTVTVGGTGAGVFANKNVGTGKSVIVSGFTLAGADADNYSIAQPTGVIANIMTASLAVTGVGVAHKVYDATTIATLTGTAAVSGLTGDTVSVAGGAGAFVNKNVGTGKSVAVSGFTLEGADAGNYSIVQPTGLTANITTASLAVTGVGAANKVYDTTTTATLTGAAAVSGLVGDTLSVTGIGVGTFADKNAGTGKSITISGFTLAGTDAANYWIVQPTGVTANITAASLAVIGVSVANKVYDANTAATLTGTAALSVLIGDTVSVTGTGAGGFANKNVGTGKAVTVSGFTLTGADAANYSIVQPTGLTANITPALLTLTGVGAVNKVYDTATVASLVGNVTGFAGDTVSVNGTGGGAFADKNVGTGKTVTVFGYTLEGTDAGNYLIVQPTSVTGNITAAPLAVTGVAAANKVYDTTLSATLTGTAAVSGLAGDTVSVAGMGSGAFADKNVGIGKGITVLGFTLTGTDAGNYSIVQPSGLTANITAAPITVIGMGAANKIYDATTFATLTGTAAVSALAGDTVSVAGTGTGSFADKTVGLGKAVTVSGFTLAGLDAANYAMIQYTGLTANISEAPLAVTGVGVANKVYDTTPIALLRGTAAVSGLAGDTVSVAAIGFGAFGDKNVGLGKEVTVSGFTLTGIDATNYSIVQPTGLTANITAAPLAVAGVGAANKVFDATTTATLTGKPEVSGLAGDTVSVSGLGSGVFSNKNVGIGKSVTVSGFTLTGTDAENYSIIQPTGLTANITAALAPVTAAAEEVVALPKLKDVPAVSRETSDTGALASDKDELRFQPQSVLPISVLSGSNQNFNIQFENTLASGQLIAQGNTTKLVLPGVEFSPLMTSGDSSIKIFSLDRGTSVTRLSQYSMVQQQGAIVFTSEALSGRPQISSEVGAVQRILKDRPQQPIAMKLQTGQNQSVSVFVWVSAEGMVGVELVKSSDPERQPVLNSSSLTLPLLAALYSHTAFKKTQIYSVVFVNN
jgi:trimeric autotransporter adhesin